MCLLPPLFFSVTLDSVRFSIINLVDICFLAKSILLYHEIHDSDAESSKLGKFQSTYTNLNYFLLLTYSCSQNSWSY